MITMFNRKELLLTTDIKRQVEVRDILSASGIDYTVKVTNLQRAAFLGGSRTRMGTVGINHDHSYEYKIYVHKRDYEQALINLNLVRRS